MKLYFCRVMVFRQYSGVFIILAFLILSLDGVAQCAMCRAVAENHAHDAESFGESLNFGILYLMAAPYIFIIGFGIWFFRKQRREREIAERNEIQP